MKVQRPDVREQALDRRLCLNMNKHISIYIYIYMYLLIYMVDVFGQFLFVCWLACLLVCLFVCLLGCLFVWLSMFRCVFVRGFKAGFQDFRAYEFSTLLSFRVRDSWMSGGFGCEVPGFGVAGLCPRCSAGV